MYRSYRVQFRTQFLYMGKLTDWRVWEEDYSSFAEMYTRMNELKSEHIQLPGKNIYGKVRETSEGFTHMQIPVQILLRKFDWLPGTTHEFQNFTDPQNNVLTNQKIV